MMRIFQSELEEAVITIRRDRRDRIVIQLSVAFHDSSFDLDDSREIFLASRVDAPCTRRCTAVLRDVRLDGCQLPATYRVINGSILDATHSATSGCVNLQQLLSAELMSLFITPKSRAPSAIWDTGFSMDVS
jgi:hypothetical protein